MGISSPLEKRVGEPDQTKSNWLKGLDLQDLQQRVGGRGEGAIPKHSSGGGGSNWPKAQLVQNMFSDEDIPPPVGPLLFLF